MSGKKWLRNFLILLIVSFIAVGGVTFFVDPFFHYRAPRDYLYYRLIDERSQNDGITKNFDYDAVITGTSMAENFKASEFDALFGTSSVKLPYSGATYKEINDNLKVSYESGHDLKFVLRTIDYSLLCTDKDLLREDMGEYPVYLTDKNIFNDVQYLLNLDVFVNYTFPALYGYFNGAIPGHTPFDEYNYTGDMNTFSRERVMANIGDFTEPEMESAATDEELLTVRENVEQNIVFLAKEHPETTFIYFFPPYSMAYWGGLKSEGSLKKQIDFTFEATKQMLECDNIHLYSFVFYDEITSDLDNYRDEAHYSPEISDLIISTLYECETKDNLGDPVLRLTRENYKNYYDKMTEYLTDYDYNSL